MVSLISYIITWLVIVAVGFLAVLFYLIKRGDIQWFFDDNGLKPYDYDFKPCSAFTSLQLEAAYLLKLPATIMYVHTSGKFYKVDFKIWQQKNMQTGFTRSLHRWVKYLDSSNLGEPFTRLRGNGARAYHLKRQVRKRPKKIKSKTILTGILPLHVIMI